MAKKLCKLYIPRLMALLLCLTVLLTCVPMARAESGACGDGLSWDYSDGVLTISGSGNMYDYGSSTAVPWYSFRQEITSVVLPSGLTSVGSHAFYGCEQLTVLDLPENVRSVGEYAFAGCRQMQLLDLGSSLETIGTGAFYSCRAIAALRLPGTLKTIGSEAFYDCTGITTLTLPSSVTDVGSAAFAYCTGLIRVEILSPLTRLPDWVFFGCRQLSSVTLPGTVTSVAPSTFQQCGNLHGINQGGSVVDKNSLQESPNPPSNPQTGNSASSASGVEHPDGSFEIQDSTVVENNNSTVTTKTEYSGGPGDLTVSNDITVTVENDKGWEEVQPAVKDALEEANKQKEEGTFEVGKNSVTVYVKDTDSIDQTFVDTLAGQDVTVNFVSQDGSVWQIKGTDLDNGNSRNQSYDLRYDLKPGSQELCRELGTEQCYVLTFREDGQINAEVMIRLNPALAMQRGTLLQRGEELKRIQTSVIDSEGYAHFYLGSVDSSTEYYIAMNLPNVGDLEEAPVIIPEEMLPAYGNAINYKPVQYEITGRKSSWDMNLGQVMGILAVVMIGAVVLVGGIMYLWNKSRLKHGYVPQWEDEEETL